MPRKPRQDAEAVGSDSFLDVVTNIVGILIILVMVVGIRVKNSPPVSSNDEQIKQEVARLAGEADALESDVLRLENQVQEVTYSAQAKYQERGTLAYLLAEQQRELEEAKQSLGTENRGSFEMRRALAAAEADLKKLGDAKAEAAKPKKRTPIQIKSYPTPISHTVFGSEVHFQLRHGRLAWVPLDEMSKLCVDAALPSKHRLEQGQDITGVVGPRQGFEAHYSFEPIDMGDGRIHPDFFLELIPISKDLGETIDDAMLPTSRFRTKLADFLPRESTVTLWTYGDSFTEYARVKEVLYGLGYHVAARPLPDDINIGGSSHGSHSAAQ
jgi:hypothetical protein